MKPNPIGHHKWLLYLGVGGFEESNLKFVDVINSGFVCCDIPTAVFGRGSLSKDQFGVFKLGIIVVN